MTTIVVVRKGDTAVIAADSLTTFGTTRLAPAYDRTRRRSPPTAIRSSAWRAAPRTSSCSRTCSRARPKLDFHGKARSTSRFRKLHPLLKDEAFLNPKEEEDDPVRVEPDDA